jgi:acyl-CoA-binding protein
MEILALFEQAVTNSKTLSTKPDNETLLKLYSLYKQSTEGDNMGEAPSNPFDFVAKAKHSSWETLKGISKMEAMQRYIALVNELKG